MKKILYTAIITLFTTTIKAQLIPEAIVDNNDFIDVLITDNAVYYATTSMIVKVDMNNEKEVIVDRFMYGNYLQGKFFETAEGFAYIGWEEHREDFSIANAIVVQYNGSEVMLDHLEIFYTFLQENNIVAANFHSKDSISLLLKKRNNDFSFKVVDLDLNVISNTTIVENSLKDMFLLEDNSNLIVGLNKIWNLKNGILQLKGVFNQAIIDVEYIPWDDKIIVLTNANIYILDTNFKIKKIISIPQSEYSNVAAHYYNDIAYVVRKDNGQTNVLALDTLGQEVSQFDEIEDVRYVNVRIKNNIFAIYGENGCDIGGRILKLDTAGVDYELPTTDLVVSDFVFENLGPVIDTLISNGDTTYLNYHVYNWSFKVTNEGSIKVDYLEASSNVINWSYNPISFKDSTMILPNETRFYSGVFKFRPLSQWSTPYVYLKVGTNQVDLNCQDNTAVFKILTSTLETAIEPTINVFPNPTSDFINLTIEGRFEYTIYDTVGRLRMKNDDAQNNQIDVTSLDKGIYLLEVFLNGNRFVERFVKE